jgi:ASC-1-like (ASCH) protein
MLLFVKKHYADQIRSGKKTVEYRAGSRYRNIKTGAIFSINGHFRVVVTKVVRLRASPSTNDCYPPDHPGPFFQFHIRMA